MVTKIVNQVRILKDKGICGGQPRIVGTRIKVQQIVLEYEGLGWTPDQICGAHPRLTLADIHGALTYYYTHKDEIDRSIENDKRFMSRLRGSVS